MIHTKLLKLNTIDNGNKMEPSQSSAKIPMENYIFFRRFSRSIFLKKSLSFPELPIISWSLDILHQVTMVSSAEGLVSGRRSHRVAPLRRPISDKLEFRLVPASPERLQPLLLIGLIWSPTRWPRRPKSRPLAEPSIIR